MRIWKVFGCLTASGLTLISLYSVFSSLQPVDIRQLRIQPRYKFSSFKEKTYTPDEPTGIKLNQSENQLAVVAPAVSSRILELQSGCQKLRDEGLVFNSIPVENLKHLIVNDEHKVMYCFIPKVACTNLKRVFLLLTGKMNETEPLKLKSSDVHFTYTKYLTFLNTYSEEEILYRIKNYRKVIFVREPLERLLSAFRNKFHQKGGVYFQERFGRKIVRHFRENPSQDSLHHGHDVTFSEFVQFLLNPKMEPNGFNEHWAPMSSLCQPCHISYDFIGKYETLDSDVMLLLKEMALNDQITFPERGDTYKNVRTEDIILEYFKTVDTRYLRDLWKIYLHDYILFGYPFPDVIKNLLAMQKN